MCGSEPCAHERGDEIKSFVAAIRALAAMTAERDAAMAALARVKWRCEDAEDNRRWLTAFEIRAAMEVAS